MMRLRGSKFVGVASVSVCFAFRFVSAPLYTRQLMTFVRLRHPEVNDKVSRIGSTLFMVKYGTD